MINNESIRSLKGIKKASMKNIPIMKPFFDDDEAKEAAAALASGWVAQGPRVAEFEKAVAAHEGTAFGIATTNCTTALHLCMVASGFGPGDDVIVPSYTFVATPNSVEYTGAAAVLTDVDIRTYNIDLEKLESLIETNYEQQREHYFNRKTKNKLAGIIPVNLFGLCADIPAANEIAKKYNLKVVEDSACAFGAKIGDTHEGCFGNPSALSFHPRKSITTGEGGMVLCNDPAFADHIRQLRSHAASLSEIQRHQSKGYLLPEYNEIGFNYRMTDIQGAIGIAQMRKIDYITKKRAELAARYDRLLPDAVPFLKIPYVPKGYTHIYQTYACMIDRDVLGLTTVEEGNHFRNELMDRLEQNGIATRQGTHATHTLGYYRKKYGYRNYDLPNSYACDRLSIALPLYVELSDEDQDYVIGKLAELSKNL
jgi:dTDP-4-amino-4,6-dideoxygalactose transaminase